MHAEEIVGCSAEVVKVRLMGLKRQAAKVRRAAGNKQVKNWPEDVRRPALAPLHDEVSPAVYGKVIWDLIFDKVEEMPKKWLKGTGDLGDHIAYVLKNRKAFTIYLSDPRMPIDNNFSERNLRPEKTHIANSRHRMTEEGRVAFDILLTMIRTCACAQVAPQDWLVWVMKNREKVAIAPEKYTPYQFRLTKKPA